MGKAYYGLELVGGNKSHLAPLQTTGPGQNTSTPTSASTTTSSCLPLLLLSTRSVTKRTPINAICSGTDNDVFTLNVQGQLVRSQRWFWSSSDQTTIQKQILADTTSQTKDSQARHSFALMETLRTCGDSAIAPKVCHSTIIGTLLGSSRIPVSTNREHMAQDI
ncbi:hypothetical protein BASA82_000762 [Batrachochytrium salamandrivorans]|nr:hypothetical protein BASA82_000762 [Batrachochytrium salamandrivorans]